MIQRCHLPTNEADWRPLLAGALGSPDPYGRQLNGMGGGVSSLSKVCVIQVSRRDDADVDYTFVQMGIKDGNMDLAGTCGNMTAAVGPFALDEGLVHPVIEDGDDGDDDDNNNNATGAKTVTVRIFNTNTNKIIHSRFSVEQEQEQDQKQGGVIWRFKPAGGYSIDGVPGTGSRITLSFLSPGGSKTGRTLPTGHPVDIMTLKLGNSGGGSGSSRDSLKLEVSLVDVANPAVIIRAADIDVDGNIAPDQLDKDVGKMNLLEEIRREGARMMGLDPSVDSIPKMVMVSVSVSAPQPKPNSTSTSAEDEDGVDIVARVLSMRQTHKAIPLTVALNLGVACHIAGSLPHSLVRRGGSGSTSTSTSSRSEGTTVVLVGHPSGKIEVGARMRDDGQVESAVLHRTARMLMRGEVFWR